MANPRVSSRITGHGHEMIEKVPCGFHFSYSRRRKVDVPFVLLTHIDFYDVLGENFMMAGRYERAALIKSRSASFVSLRNDCAE